MARVNWEPVPASALESKPIILYRGDILIIDGHIGRYWSFNISPCRLEVRNLLSKELVDSEFPVTPASWNSSTHITVLHEDCLGHCYSHIVVNQEDSTFSDV